MYHTLPLDTGKYTYKTKWLQLDDEIPRVANLFMCISTYSYAVNDNYIYESRNVIWFVFVSNLKTNDAASSKNLIYKVILFMHCTQGLQTRGPDLHCAPTLIIYATWSHHCVAVVPQVLWSKKGSCSHRLLTMLCQIAGRLTSLRK